VHSFLSFLIEERGTITAKGKDADRHRKQYLDPYVGSKAATHTLSKSHDHLESGARVRIHRVVNVDGTNHAEVSTEGSRVKSLVPVSKLQKPGETKNKGIEYEQSFYNRVKNRGLVPEGDTGPAGSTAGSDVAVLNKKNATVHPGKIQSAGKIFHGEVKEDVSAAMGQLTIKFDPKKGGWHIPDDARKNRPRYAKQIENAGILEHMNAHYRPDKHDIVYTPSGRAQNVVLKHPDLAPADAYLQDHHAHFVQIGSGFGTYRVGSRDKTGHGLPKLTGVGKWTIRDKQVNPNSRTVMFQPDGKRGLNQSNVNLDDDEHLELFAKTLGHK
jgi:hypothetical protein